MDIIIDGYNLIGFQRGLEGGLELKRNWLLQQLAEYHRRKSLSIIVVFDGWQAGASRETEEKRNELRVIYSQLGEKADSVIIRIAREKGSGCVVVTSDREIRRAIERFGAVAIYAEEFNRILRELEMGPGDDSFAVDDQATSRQGNPSRLPKDERKRLEKLKKLRIG